MAKCRSCDLPTVGKSSYCSTHRAVARNEWKARIADDYEVRQARKSAHAELWARACESAREAWNNASPTPMVVTDTRSGQKWHVSEGVCGFASLVVKPANSSFALWLKKNANTSRHYDGGLSVWSSVVVPEDAASQSYERKVAAMRAAAKVLTDAGVRARVWSRLD